MIEPGPNRARTGIERALLAVLVGLTLSHPGLSPVVHAAARGTLAGRVFEKSSDQHVPDVTISAYALTSNEEFQTMTDATGGFHVENAPTSVYSFSLRVDGVEYVVQERLDVRVGMPFLLESCFELDGDTRTAHVLDPCDSGLVEPARVATIGPHRFLIPENPRYQEPQAPAEQSSPAPSSDAGGSDIDSSAPTEPGATGTTDLPAENSELPIDLVAGEDSGSVMPDAILHEELECLTYEHFPIVDANIAPGDMIQISRVYFRSDKYPDFYYVDMGPEHPTIDDFQAILPKPSPETERIYYYVESVDSNFDTLQTPEFDPEVLEVQACEERGGLWFLGEDPNIVVGATTAGAAALPPGFQAVGITGFVSSLGVLTTVSGAAAAGGGVASTSGLVLVVAGGTAAAAGTTVAVTGDEEASPP